jgi:LmbE family N-acetylglucosaminyl deacetylase
VTARHILVVQAHFDDAVFSIAEHMLTWLGDGDKIDILTVFGAVPEGAQKEETLFEEHDMAMTRLGLDGWYQLDFTDDAWLERGLDSPFQHPHYAAIEQGIADIVARVKPDVICVPTGIHHPDHGVASAATQALGSDVYPAMEWWWYDELPYYVLYPHEVLAVAYWEEFDDFYQRVGSRDFYVAKQGLVQCYGSQVDEALVRCLMVPERVWEAR